MASLDPRPCMLPGVTCFQANRDAEAWRFQIVSERRSLARAVEQQRRVLEICQRTAPPPTPFRRTAQPFASSRPSTSASLSSMHVSDAHLATSRAFAPFSSRAQLPEFYEAHSPFRDLSRHNSPALQPARFTPPLRETYALRRERDWSPELRGKYGGARSPDLPPIPRNRYWTQMFVEAPTRR